MNLRISLAVTLLLLLSRTSGAEQPDFVDVPTPQDDSGPSTPCMSVGTEIPSCEASFWCCSGCCSYVGGVTQCVECGAPIPEPESDWAGAAEIVESPPVPPDFDHYEADIVSALDGSANDGDAEPASLSDSSAGAGDANPAKASGDGGCSVTGHSSPSAARPFGAFGFAAVGFTFIALLGGMGRVGFMRRLRAIGLGLVASAFTASCSSASGSTPPSSAAPRLGSGSKALSAELEKVRAEFGIRSISAIAWRDGAVTAQAATGIADIRTNAAATPDSIYMIASCSKPIVGLALAVLMTEQTIDLDADINTWLKWSSPPRNPGHPGVPVTLRQLVTHRSSLGADDEYEYATYARPDPDSNMEPYFKELLPDSEMWEDFAPGEKEEYSNVGTALAALVIEKAAKTPFSKYCQDRLFTPLGLDDTGWFFADFDAGQVSRMARPHDEKGSGLEHFGFPNWPSGQIRTTTGDLARLWMAVQSRKAPFTNALLANFEKVPFFIQHDGDLFDHGGSEYGVGAYFVFDTDGNGYAFLSNHEMPEEQSDELDQALAAILRKYSGVKE